jgi:hypothetical protein
MTACLVGKAAQEPRQGVDAARIVTSRSAYGLTREGAVNVVEPGHELTATPSDPDGRCTTICECGWVSQLGVEAQPFLEARDHIVSVREGRQE